MAKKKASRRPRTRSRARKTQRSSAKGLHVRSDQLAWIGGMAILAVALVTLLSLFTPHRGHLTEWWVRTLAHLLGWGRFVVPIALGLGAFWLLGRAASSPLAWPRLRLLGTCLILLALLGFHHHLLPDRSTAAANGQGGGLLGYYLSLSLEAALGWTGAIVVFIIVLGLGLTLALDLSIQEIVSDAIAWKRRIETWWAAQREHRAAEKAQRPTPPTSLEKPSMPQVPQPAAKPRTSESPPEIEVPFPSQPTSGASSWELPSIETLLREDDDSPLSLADIREKTRLIEETLYSFGVPATVVEVNPGPVVTQYGIEPGYIERKDRKGKTQRVRVQVSKIAALANDLALALAAAPIRIEAPVPGKGIVGIEVPNSEQALVGLRGVMESEEFAALANRPLAVGLGRDVSGAPVVTDLASLPHLLIAGATNSGKSVCINALIACLLCRNTPDTLRLLLVDPKRVELSHYNGIPHLLAPVVVEPSRVVGVLKWVVREMDRRYKLFAQVGARNLQAFNAQAAASGEAGLPYIVVFIDELADLMMVAPDEVERLICRIAQLSRATGIHLVIATQRPSVDVVTGLIKANFPARLSFLVSSQVDSRVILDTPGAEKLLGHGDALYMAPDSPKLVRLQGCYVSDGEIEALVRFWKAQAPPSSEALLPEQGAPSKGKQKPLWPDLIPSEEMAKEEEDPLLQKAIDLVVNEGHASVSFLQRSLRIGYTRASRLIDTLEEKGIIGPATGTSKAREVLIKPQNTQGTDSEPSEPGGNR